MTEQDNSEIRVCLECGQPVGPGRNDRKYCSDACKTAYNNSVRKAKAKPGIAAWRYPYYDKIDQILRSNRDILEKLYFEDRHVNLTRHDLGGYGFNFKYFTSFHDAPDMGSGFYFVYDYGYAFDGERVEIAIRPEEIMC